MYLPKSFQTEDLAELQAFMCAYNFASWHTLCSNASPAQESAKLTSPEMIVRHREGRMAPHHLLRGYWRYDAMWP